MYNPSMEGTMRQKNSQLLKLTGTILGITFIISLIVLLIGFIVQWNTAKQFSNAFFIAGAIAVVLGLLSVSGGFAQRADFKMTYSESAGDANLFQRSQRMMGDVAQ